MIIHHDLKKQDVPPLIHIISNHIDTYRCFHSPQADSVQCCIVMFLAAMHKKIIYLLDYWIDMQFREEEKTLQP